MATYKYIVDILAKNGQFVSSMNQSVQKIGEMDKKVKTAQNNVNGLMDNVKKFAGAVGIAFSVGALVEWGKESVKLVRQKS
jgi:Holliday junction resolvase